MTEVLLDTDTLSEILKRKDLQVLERAKRYLSQNQRLAFSAMTVFEIVRGMRANGATRQLSEFLKLVDTSEIFPVSISVLHRAAALWADGRNGGHPHNDADMIIAATALEAERVLVTGNTSHFSWIEGLRIEDWRLVSG